MKLLALFLLICGMSGSGYADESKLVEPQVQRGKQSVISVQRNQQEPRLEEAVSPETKKIEKPTPVDVSPLWDEFHAGNYAVVRNRIAAIRKEHPDWQPPEELMRLLVEAEVDEALHKKPKQVIAAYRAHPELFNCSNQYRRLALADAWLNLKQVRKARDVYETIHWRCKEYLRLEALEHASARMPLADMDYLLHLSESKPVSSKGSQRMAALKLRQLLRQWHEGGGSQLPAELLRRADALQPDLLRLRSPAMAATLGWLNMEQKRYARARELFELSRSWRAHDDALKGLILADYHLGRFEEMKQLIDAHHERLAQSGMLADVLPLQAAHCASVGDDACLLETLDQLATLRPLHAGERKSRAWALYHTGRYAEAADAFEPLYRLKPEEDIAGGLYYSLVHSGQLDRAAGLARDMGGALAAVAGNSDARRMFDHHLFHAARQLDESFHPSLAHVDTPFVRTSFMRRVQSSTSAVPLLSTFELRKYVLETGYVYNGTNIVNLQVERTFINAGDPLLRANDIGFKLLPPYAFPVRSFLQGYEWDIEYRHEGWNSYYASVGQGFSGASLQPTLKARLGTRRQYEKGELRLEAYRQPLRDRILAYVGLDDPKTGLQWGRVSRNGLSVEGYHALGDSDWGLGYTGREERLNGVSVQNNSHYAVSLTLPYNFRLTDGWHASLGPQLQWQRYARNQNHFTVGDGGYFSPQRDTTYGLSMHAFTDEGRRLHAVFDVFVGRRAHAQDAAEVFPLAPNGLLYPASSVTETVFSTHAAAVIRLTSHLQLGADASYWKSSYTVLNVPTRINDLGWMVWLSWQFDARQGSLSMDYPPRGLSPLY